MTTYADTLGKAIKQSKDGHYRLYKVEGMFAIYLVGKEIIDITDTEIIYGERDEAVFGGYLSDPNNFEFGISEIQNEIANLI